MPLSVVAYAVIALTMLLRIYQRRPPNQAWPEVYIMATPRHSRWFRKHSGVSARSSYLRPLPPDLLLLARLVLLSPTQLIYRSRVCWDQAVPPPQPVQDINYMTSVHQAERHQITSRHNKSLALVNRSINLDPTYHRSNTTKCPHIPRLMHMIWFPIVALMTSGSTRTRRPDLPTGVLRRIPVMVVRGVFMGDIHPTTTHHL
jgi:hypothetical protein